MKIIKNIIIVLLFYETVCVAQVVKDIRRVIHFPNDRSLGTLYVGDVSKNKVDCILYRGIVFDNENYFSQTKGDMAVEAGQIWGLEMKTPSVRNLSTLCEIGSDIYYLKIDNKMIKGENLAKLADLKQLKVLGLDSTSLQDRDLKFINEIKSIEVLSLPRTVSNAGITQLEGLKSLKALYLSGPRVTDEGLAQLAKTTQLKDIYIYVSEQGDLAFLQRIARLPGLRYHIGISDKIYTGAVAKYLQGADSLVWLSLRYSPVKRSELLVFSKLPKLEFLELLEVPIRDDDIACLQNISSLKNLNLDDVAGSSKLTDAGMDHIAKLTQLEILYLPSTITDNGLAKLTGLNNLQYLCLGSNKGLTDEGIGHISKLIKLKILILFTSHSNINYCVLTDKSMEYLSKLKSLEELYLHGSEITDAGFGYLKNLKSMKKLDIGCSKITLSGINSVVNNMTELTSLSILPVMQDDCVLDISCLTKLKTLEICTAGNSGNAIKDADLVCLQGLTHLERLILVERRRNRNQKYNISDKGVSYLKNLTNLNQLWIAGSNFTDQGLVYLANMKNLDVLSVTGNFTDDGLKSLEGLKELSNLMIYSDNELSRSALMDFQKKLPQLNTGFWKNSKKRIDLMAGRRKSN